MINVNQRACPQNHRCPSIRTCPVGAIIQDSPNSAPYIDHTLCTDCGVCVKSCHVFSQIPDAVGAR